MACIAHERHRSFLFAREPTALFVGQLEGHALAKRIFTIGYVALSVEPKFAGVHHWQRNICLRIITGINKSIIDKFGDVIQIIAYVGATWELSFQ
jgi:hypothetical protein